MRKRRSQVDLIISLRLSVAAYLVRNVWCQAARLFDQNDEGFVGNFVSPAS